VSDLLATTYGDMPLPGSAEPQWVSYGSSGRKGLLSHGSFLAVGATTSDTSPIKRGLLIRRRLLCQELPEPPPTLNVDDVFTDVTGDCKWDLFAPTRVLGCVGCHESIDPVGWGLENYDLSGGFRADDALGCSLEERGIGELVGIGSFRGPGELSDLLVPTGDLQACLVEQVYRLMVGRGELTGEDEDFLETVVGSLEADFAFHELIIQLVSSKSFLHRKDA